MNSPEELENIWNGDRLNRRQEADTIERFVKNEVNFFEKVGRNQSIVFGIDSPYGKGKSWFLERLGKQLALSHPVAVIDAWADDAGDEPLTAFMSAIDDSLAPYLSKSKKLQDRLAAAKAAAFPVIGKLVAGAAIKAISKIAGDQIDDQIGHAIEDAVRGTKTSVKLPEEGAVSQASTAAFEKLDTEISSLVDRGGAAMLAAYRKRKQSRENFRQNMAELVVAIDHTETCGSSPLIVIIDELDRCRPHYAIRMLEEIKHFFEIPRVVFIVGLHGKQLSKSVNAIYGAEFDSEDYLRRFFTRRYELRSQSIVELVASVFEEWAIDENKFVFPEPIVTDGYPLTKPRILGQILSEWFVTPREVYPIMDALRLFVDGWEHAEPIESVSLLSALVQLVRGQEFNFLQPEEKGQIKFKGFSWFTDSAANPSDFKLSQYLELLSGIAWKPLHEIVNDNPRQRDASRNYLVGYLQSEFKLRQQILIKGAKQQSYITDYIPRICDLARFVETH